MSTPAEAPRARWGWACRGCLLYTSDAADDLTRVDLGGRRIIKKKNNIAKIYRRYKAINFFFFQAEDGIRDAQESRGLGDVYKRQRQLKLRAPAGDGLAE